VSQTITSLDRDETIVNMAHALRYLDDVALGSFPSRDECYRREGIPFEQMSDWRLDRYALANERHRRAIFKITIPPKTLPATDPLGEIRAKVKAETERLQHRREVA
jgi:hypothetical protein